MLKFREFLKEGNPLARMYQHSKEGRHFVGISAARPGQSKKERKAATEKLQKYLRKRGYGYRKAEGHYEGDKEPSLVVHAKRRGTRAGKKLLKLAKKAGSRHDQDSILHHDGKTAKLVGTNKTGFPGKGKSEKVGTKLKYNNPESPFQTELRPGKGRGPARFTT